MNFNKNKLINKTLDKYYETFSHTLDTADYVPEKFNEKIHKYIYKNLKAKFREIEIFNLLDLQAHGYKLSLLDKLRIWLSGLKPLYLAETKSNRIVKEKADYFLEQKINECDSTSAFDNS